MRKGSDIRKACNNCIRAKAACDNARPCSRCLSHKLADTCANVPRKNNATKRKRFGETEMAPDDNPLSYMINNSLNNIITNLNSNNNNGAYNNYPLMPHVEGEVNGHTVVNNVINTAIQNLNSRSTSAIISNTISNLNYHNQMPLEPPPSIKTVPHEMESYESVLQWLQSAATNVQAPLAPMPPEHPNRSTPHMNNPPNAPPLHRSSPQFHSYQPPQEPPLEYNSYAFLPPPMPAPIQNTFPPQNIPLQYAPAPLQAPTPLPPPTPSYSPPTPSLPPPTPSLPPHTPSLPPSTPSLPPLTPSIPPPTPSLPPSTPSLPPPPSLTPPTPSIPPPSPAQTSQQLPSLQSLIQAQQHIAQPYAHHSPSLPSPNLSPSQSVLTPIHSPLITTPQQPSAPQSPSHGAVPSPCSSSSTSDGAPDSPLLLPENSPNGDVPSLPTLNITIYTKPNRSTAAAYAYVSNLLRHSPQGTHSTPEDSQTQAQAPHPHNISIPFCSAGSLVQTLSLLRQYSAIDMNSPIHIDYTYKSVPLKPQPVALIEISGPTLVDCNDAFGQVLGFKTGHELLSQNRPVSDYMLPEGIAISKRTVELFFRLKTSRIERYQVFLLRNRPARVFLAQHELVGSRHRTVTFLEEYPDFPLCFFSDWIKTILPNAVLPPCSRPYCHCKYPDEYAKVG